MKKSTHRFFVDGKNSLAVLEQFGPWHRILVGFIGSGLGI